MKRMKKQTGFCRISALTMAAGSLLALNFCACQSVTIAPAEKQNNLVSVLPVQEGEETGKYSFTTAENGWVYINFTASDPTSGKLEVTLDEETVQLETMRYLSAGEHILVLPDCADGLLTVKRIPSIYVFAAGISFMPEVNGYYDYLTLQERYLASTNLLHPGNMTTEAIHDYLSEGRKLLDNVHAAAVVEGDIPRFHEVIANSRAMQHDEYAGFTVDEFNFTNDDELKAYPEALATLPDLKGRELYTCIYGDPREISEAQRKFVAAALDEPQYGGKLLLEVYCRTWPTQAEAERFLDEKLERNMQAVKAINPKIAERCGIILGSFNLMPYISLDHYPSVDYKVYLDMQMNRLANSEEFDQLSMVGYWGNSLIDEDLQHWSLELLRHYCVEGKRTMLSDEYNYQYELPYLINNDFKKGVEGWKATVGRDGAITPQSNPTFAEDSIGIWQRGGSDAGDYFIVFKRGSEPNYLQQTAKSLTVGETYMLEYVTADYQDILHATVNPMDHVLHAELPEENADVLSVREYIDMRPQHFYGKTDFARINLKQIIFKAKTSELPVTFTDHISTIVPGVGKFGQEKVLAFVRIKPFFPDVRK